MASIHQALMPVGHVYLPDHATELQLTQVRLKELEGICSGQRSEVSQQITTYFCFISSSILILYMLHALSNFVIFNENLKESLYGN